MLTKQKTFSAKPRLQSNAKKLADWMGGANTDTAIRVEDADEIPAVLLEEDAEEVSLSDIPEAPTTNSRSKRARADDDDDEHIFVQSEEDEEEDLAPKRRKKTKVTDTEAQEDEDKKKLGMKTSYEGFSIYGRILCLIVKRKGVKKSVGGNTAGTQMLENWVSTQADNEGALDDVEDG
jgi:Zn-dependent metalloprotease